MCKEISFIGGCLEETLTQEEKQHIKKMIDEAFIEKINKRKESGFYNDVVQKAIDKSTVNK